MGDGDGESIYEVSFEIEPNDGAEFPDDCVGAFVNCYLGAPSLRDALDLAQEFMEDDSYRVLDIDRAMRLDIEDYEPQDEDCPTREELVAALEAGEILTGPFLCYEDGDDEDEDDD